MDTLVLAVMVALTLGTPSSAWTGRVAVSPDSNCRFEAIEMAQVDVRPEIGSAAADTLLRSIRFWLRPAPRGTLGRTARVSVRVGSRTGVVPRLTSASDSSFGVAALTSVQLAARDGVFARFVPIDSAATDSVVVRFGLDARGRALGSARRTICLATERPGNPPVRYPQSLRTDYDEPTAYGDAIHPVTKKSGIVKAIFRVDTLGHVVPGAVVITSSPNEAFSAEVLRVIQSYRYEPATIDGRPTPQVVEQSFTFDLRYGNGTSH